LIDADMVLKGAARLKEIVDQADLWDIRQQNATIIYHNLRVIRASIDVVCMCPTHEYYDVRTPDAVRKTFEDIVIEDIGDGGAKDDKAERDIRLLKEALTQEPKNCRYWFYLANTYRDVQDYANAILAYNQRVEIGGWFEETYCALVYKGDCHMVLGQITDSIMSYLSAYQIDPLRGESLIRIANFYRINSQHHLAMLFIEKGLKLDLPKERLLFVEKHVYDWRFLYEMSISAFYVKDLHRGRLACMMLLEKKDIPDFIRESTQNNLKFYQEKS
jgi:tetratricopeptide (TPR) repeat protein